MRLVYIGHTDEVFVPAADAFAPNGVPVEIPDEIAKRLLEQACWIAAEKPEAPKVNLNK